MTFEDGWDADAKSIICMDGLDLHEALSGGLDFGAVIATKARRAAETGAPFASVRDLDVSPAVKSLCPVIGGGIGGSR